MWRYSAFHFSGFREPRRSRPWLTSSPGFRCFLYDNCLYPPGILGSEVGSLAKIVTARPLNRFQSIANLMVQSPSFYPQSDPPQSPRLTMPTMYDLPSESLEEPGLPDEFHWLQPELLRQTFRPPHYGDDQVFVGSDLNLYYDPRHPQWYKRPDWFAVVGGTRLYEGQELRLSYVIWQEGITPMIVLELISPSTEAEDLGNTLRAVDQPPTKWQVYEQILRIPYYAILNRYTNEFRMHRLVAGSYQAILANERGVWLPEVQLGLGFWSGNFQGIERPWLRWYAKDGQWILTPAEVALLEKQRAETEKQRAETEKQRADLAECQLEQERQQRQRLIERLRALGIDPDSDGQ